MEDQTIAPGAAEELAPGTHSTPPEGVESTLGEHGLRTTIGCDEIELEPPGLPLQLKIGREVHGDPKCTKVLGRRVMRALAVTVKRLGSKDLDGLSLAERTVVAGQLPIVDLQYVSLLQMAAENAGRYDLPIPEETPCPRCKMTLPTQVRVQLHDTRLLYFRKVPSIRYRLRDPFRMLAQDVTEITLGPPTVMRAMEGARDLDFSVDVLRELRWVAAAVTHVNGVEGPITYTALGSTDPGTGRGMSTEDWAGLKQAFNHVYGYVEPSVKWVHSCGEELMIEIPWQEAFFVPPGG